MRLAACCTVLQALRSSTTAQALAAAPGLVRLDLSGNLLEDDKARLLAGGLARARVTHLSLSHNRAQLLVDPNTLEELVLDNNQILAPGGRALAHALRGNPALVSLQLQLNRLGDEGGCALAEALLGNSGLQRLGLCGNRLGSQAAAAFSWMLRSNSSLSEMDLSCNALGPAGGAELLAALQHNTTVVRLGLAHSQVGNEAAEAIVSELRKRRCLL